MKSLLLIYLWEYSTRKLSKETYRNVWEKMGNNVDKMEVEGLFSQAVFTIAHGDISKTDQTNQIKNRHS